ncbi:Cupredoxin, partial [Phaeosphaeriaceae sp. PMI808]
LEFNPKSVTAKAGDTVVFKLYAAHNVVQGDIASPCTPSGQGFYSGPYSETNGGKLRFVVNVTNTDPIYYYCSVSRHCQAGMVGGINLP